MNDFTEDLEKAPTQTIYKILLTSQNKLDTHDRILASISGGGR